MLTLEITEYIHTLKNQHTHDSPLPYITFIIMEAYSSRYFLCACISIFILVYYIFFFLNRYVYNIFKSLFDISL